MSKDVNIHLKTTGAGKTKADLDKTGQAAKDLGDKTAEGQNKAAAGVDQTNAKLRDQHGRFLKTGQSARQLGDKTAEGQNKAGAATQKSTGKLSRMGGVLNRLSTQVAAFIGAWLGLTAVIATVTELIQKLQRVEQLQKDIYRQSLSYAEVGQALEIQTGTIGKQQFWTEQAIELQKAGALASAAVAGEMLTAMDVAFKARGGIKDPVIRDLGKDLAPFIGAAGYSPEQAGQLFQLGAVAGVEPTATAYLEFMAKQHAAYTTSMSVDPGAFLSGFTKGGIPYIGMGGTPEDALARYSAAVAITSSEELAGRLLEQASRVASGGREKSRLAMEESQRVSWSDLTMDERMVGMLEHVKSIPQNIRSQTLVEQGFPEELSNKINMLIIDRAEDTYEDTLNALYNATPDFIAAQGQAYLESMLGKSRLQEATTSLRRAAIGPKYADWQTRLQDAQDKTTELAGEGDIRSILHPAAPYLLALETMLSDTEALYDSLEDDSDKKAAQALADNIKFSIQRLREDLFVAKLGLYGPKIGLKYEKTLQELANKASPIETPTSPPQPTPTSPPPSDEPPTQPTPTPPPPSDEPPTQPTPTPPPPDEPLVVNNFDHRVINYTIHNPVAGINKQDLGIEPPRLSV